MTGPLFWRLIGSPHPTERVHSRGTREKGIGEIMAYRPPVYNIFAKVWSMSSLGVSTLRGYTPCQLRGPAASGFQNVTPSGDYSPVFWEALFPKGTDIRDRFTAGAGFIQDLVEISPGTGRFYNVVYWDDKAAGFSNEYRLVYLEKNFVNGTTFPYPTVDSAYAPPPGGPWVDPYTGP